MAKIKVAGSAVVVESSVKLNDIMRVKKYRPEALTIKDENGDVTFCVGITHCGCGSINEFGVEFSDVSHNADGLATVTLINAIESGEDIKESIADMIGGSVVSLKKIEEKIPSVLAEINAERTAIISGIEMA